MTKYTEDEKKLIKELKTQEEKQQWNNRWGIEKKCEKNRKVKKKMN